jgi:metal-sulfur cluster biosynthetic enzyme
MTEVDMTTLPTEDEVRASLKSVYDPEIGISILDLGLVYGVQIDPDSKNVIIDMTLTTPACPLGPVIKTQAHAVVTNRFPAVNDVDINLVWTPRWDPRIMASEEAKAERPAMKSPARFAGRWGGSGCACWRGSWNG